MSLFLWLLSCTTVPEPGDTPSLVPSEEGWEHCPTTAHHVGDATWTGNLTVEEDDLLCVYTQRGQSNVYGLQNKRRARVVPGAYPMPDEPRLEPWTWRLPVCFQGEPDLPWVDTGFLVVSDHFEFPGALRWTAELPLGPGKLEFLGFARSAAGYTVGETGSFSTDTKIWRCDDAACGEPLMYVGCGPREPNHCDEVVFDGGAVRLNQHVWGGWAGQGFATLERADGVLDGEQFVVEAYERTSVSYGQHAQSRDVLILFDAPIGQACGLQARNLQAPDWPGPSSVIELVDCDGYPVEHREVESTKKAEAACPD